MFYGSCLFKMTYFEKGLGRASEIRWDDRYISQGDRWRENYCLAKADVDVALLHKSYGLSIVVDSIASRHWLNGTSFAFNEPIRDDRGRGSVEKGGFDATGRKTTTNKSKV